MLLEPACHSWPHTPKTETATENFQHESDEYFDQVYFPNQPTSDAHRLPPVRHATGRLLAQKYRCLDRRPHEFEKRIQRDFPRHALDQTTRGDREMVLGNIHSPLLTLETIRPGKESRHAIRALSPTAHSLLMERKFAPPDDRLRSLIAREKLMPSRLDCRSARQPQESAAHLHRDRHRADFPASSAFSRTMCPWPLPTPGSRAQGRIREDQCRGHRRAERLSRLAQVRPACHAPTATSASGPIPSRRSCNTTRWSTSRSTSCSRSAVPTCTRISSTSTSREGTRTRQESARQSSKS